MPSENPNLDERGLIITDFVDRVGDPVAIVAADGSTHRADQVLADALRAMLYAVGGRPAAGRTRRRHLSGALAPGRRRRAAQCAGRGAGIRRAETAAVVSDATAALTALQNDPGVPARGIIALCDFGGTGTSITLVDAANGFRRSARPCGTPTCPATSSTRRC